MKIAKLLPSLKTQPVWWMAVTNWPYPGITNLLLLWRTIVFRLCAGSNSLRRDLRRISPWRRSIARPWMNTSRKAMLGKFQIIRSILVPNLCGTCHTTRSSTRTNLVRYDTIWRYFAKWPAASRPQSDKPYRSVAQILARTSGADVEQMFHQVRVVLDDSHDLRFLWCEDSDLSKNPVNHQMLVHLFGTSSPPCCASFALKKTANDFSGDFDAQSVDTVNCNFYMNLWLIVAVTYTT